MPLDPPKGPLKIDIQLVLRWREVDCGWELYLPERDFGICDETGGIDPRMMYLSTACTLHLPLNGREQPFITCSPVQTHNAPVKSGKP